MARRSADGNFKSLRGKPSDYDGNRMGLTEAFAPVQASSFRENDADNPIGLTEAFEPVTASGMPVRRREEGPSAEGFGFDGAAADPAQRARHGKHARVQDAEEVPAVSSARMADQAGHYQKKSRRMRKVLIAVVVLLVALIAALGYFTARLVDESKTFASQQMQDRQDEQDGNAMQQDEASDVSAQVSKKTDIVALASLLGLSQDEAIAAIGHGASVTSTREVDSKESDIKQELTLALTDEPADVQSGTPSVYLSLNKDGAVVRAGYSAATSALGYGSLSFADAVCAEHIVENSLNEAGIFVEEGSAALPEDSTEYSSYDTDGTTLLKEKCSFSGTGTIDGTQHTWDAVLLYDYVAANASGNLSDTIRVLYIYVNA